jgi:hypothetical protein
VWQQHQQTKLQHSLTSEQLPPQQLQQKEDQQLPFEEHQKLHNLINYEPISLSSRSSTVRFHRGTCASIPNVAGKVKAARLPNLPGGNS